jgi:hypothetical protein
MGERAAGFGGPFVFAVFFFRFRKYHRAGFRARGTATKILSRFPP